MAGSNKPELPQSSHLRCVSKGRSAMTEDDKGLAREAMTDLRPQFAAAEQHMEAMHRQFTLSVHDESFSKDDVVLNFNENERLPAGILLRIIPIRGNVFYHNGKPNDEDLDLNKQYVFIYKPASQGLLLKQPGVQVSLLRSIASNLNLPKGAWVLVSTAELATSSASHVEIVFRDQYLARADMWRLVSAELLNTSIFRGQKVFFIGTVKATIKSIFVNGRRVPSALFHSLTKPIFRSESARYVMLIQMSKEMWDFDAEGSGEIMFDKVISGFLPQLFRRWQDLKVRHLVSIVLFSRMVYEINTDDARTEPKAVLAKSSGTLRDFYRVVVSDMASGEWPAILAQLKKEFLVFLRDISISTFEASDNSLDPGISSASTDPPKHLITGCPSVATHGNVLEAINLASAQFSSDYVDRDLVRTGVSIVVISPSAGLFEVDYDLLTTTTENLIDNGVGIDLVCLSKMPLHSVPLFKYRIPWSSSEDVSSIVIDNTNRAGDAVEESFPDEMILRVPSGASQIDRGVLTVPRTHSNSKHVKWSYGIPHWIDISFWDSVPDKSGGSKRVVTRKKLKHKSSFDTPLHKAFIPRVKLYELQMVGVMENELSDMSIPQLTNPFQSQTGLSQRRGSKLLMGSSPKNPSLHSTFGSYLSPRNLSSDHASKVSGSLMSNYSSDQESTGSLCDGMDEYDDLVFRHPLDARKRSRRAMLFKDGPKKPQVHDRSPKGTSPPGGARQMSSGRMKLRSDREKLLSQAKVERHARQEKAASRGGLASPASNIQSSGSKSNVAGRQISFGPRGFGASASKAVASTELSIDHGAASLSRGLKWRPSARDADDASAVSAHAVGKGLESRKPGNVASNNSDTAPSSESDSQKSSRPIPIRNAIAMRIEDEGDRQSRVRGRNEKPTNVEFHGRLAELQDLREVVQDTLSLEVEEANDTHQQRTTLSPNTTLAPWLTILNPSNPSKTRNMLASRLGRWQHVFPRPLRNSQIKWKSLCSPAAVPLTTEDFPSADQLSEEYQASTYCVNIPERLDLAAAPRSLVTELIAFRLSRGFQIVVGARLSESVKMASALSKPFNVLGEHILTESCSTVFLSRGGTIHQIERLNDTMVEVKQLIRHKKLVAARHTESESMLYKPYIRSMMTEEYEIQKIPIAPQSADFDWKTIDSFIVGNERPRAQNFVDSLRPWRARYVLIPVATPTNARRPLNSINEDDDEEIRLEGIRKLSQVWQRFRHVPLDERRFQAPLRDRKDTNPLDIMYQTRNPSAIIVAELENMAEGDASGRPVQLLPESDLFQRSGYKISALAETIQGEKGVRMLDRRWHWRLHYNCFIGFEFATWLLQNFRDIDTRDEAVELGKELMRDGMFKHVQGRHDFRDGNYFYQIADEYRAPRPESRGWFGRSKPSVPSTPVSEDLPKDSPMNSRSRASSSSAESNADATGSNTPTSKKPKLGVALSKSLLYDVDHRKRSYRPELINLHYDRLHNPDNCYHIRIEWMNTTSKLIQDTIISWATSVDRFGLRLVEVPIGEISRVTDMHPFRSPFRIKLKLKPPVKQPQSYFDHTSFSPRLKIQRNYYQKALLKRFDFVLDFEAASDFHPDVDVTYSWGKPDYTYPQYIHRSGSLIAQITDEGDFLLLANRLYSNRGGLSGSSDQNVPQTDKQSDGEGHRGPGFFKSNLHSGGISNLHSSPHLSSCSSPPISGTLEVPTSTPKTMRVPLPVDSTSQVTSSLKDKPSFTSATPESIKQMLGAFCHDREALEKFYEEVLSKESTPGPNTPFLGGKTPTRGPLTPFKGAEKLSLDSVIPNLALPETLVGNRMSRERGLEKGEKD